MNKHEELILERCIDFCEILVTGALFNPIPASVLDSVEHLIKAKMTNERPAMEDMLTLNDALIGTARGFGYYDHLKKYYLDYIASVLAIMETAYESIDEDETLQ